MTVQDGRESLSVGYKQTPPSPFDGALDRLSSLPNELLDHIFNLAHTLDHPSTGALSKHLLPFHISGLYRRIHLKKLSNFLQLVDKVSRERDYGERIRSLKIDHSLQSPTPMDSFPLDDVGPFFQCLSRLEDLDLAGDNSAWDEDDIYILEVFDETTFLASETVMPSVVALRVQERFPVLWLRAFPSLVRLEYVQFDEATNDGPNPPNDLVLHQLEYLSFTGVYADHPSIASYCSLCPNLRHLRLCVENDYAGYGALIPLLPTTLVSLELESDQRYPLDTCDDSVPRLTQLERLFLDGGHFTRQLPMYLASLSHLKELRLGEGKFSIDQFRSLVSGPTRLPSFRKLTLDHGRGSKFASRIGMDDEELIGGRRIPDEDSYTEEHWVLPGFYDDDGSDAFSPTRIRELIRIARHEGIDVDGNVLGALEVVDAHLLAEANVAVYRSFKARDIRHIAALKKRGPHFCGRLPSLDLDALDPKNLELVKTDLPDEGWFQLSLRNKGS
ncbi:hypothetical protein JCM11491_006074 [Sporobolomyces phaffii]